jgi:hypothetical protein
MELSGKGERYVRKKGTKEIPRKCKRLFQDLYHGNVTHAVPHNLLF